MKPLIFDLSENINLSASIKEQINGEMGKIYFDSFADGESSIQINSDCLDKDVVVISNLSHPNKKLLPLLLVSQIVKEYGASKVILIAPYLPYMRQDAEFKKGQSALAMHFATIISQNFDALITVAPHLHRYFCLEQIYSIPCYIAHIGKQISCWISENFDQPLLIGPDHESLQWVREIAQEINAPFLIGNKQRFADSEVMIEIDGIGLYPNHQPVIVDDIVSTGGTVLEMSRYLSSSGFKNIACVGIHAIFSGHSFIDLTHSPIKQTVTSNSLPHVSNVIDISQAISDVYKLMRQR